jgi:hypothetical protein
MDEHECHEGETDVDVNGIADVQELQCDECRGRRREKPEVHEQSRSNPPSGRFIDRSFR